MGAGPSYENEYRESQRTMEEMRCRAEKAAEENGRIQAEKERMQAENHAKELQRVREDRARENRVREDRAREDKARLEATHRLQEEARNLQEKVKREEENHARELQWKEENHARELQWKEENHARELQGAREDKARLEETHRLQEEARKLQEKVRREEEKKMAEMARKIEEEARQRVEEEKKMAEMARKIEEEARRRVEEEKKMAEMARKIEEEARRRVEEEKKMAEMARKIEEEARQRVEEEVCLREEAERNLEKGVPPAKYPTGEEFAVTRKRLQYQEGDLHFAITGASGVGKSSLINAFRGLSNSNSNKNPNLAKTGTSETTERIGRYCDPARPWLAWYDVPGAGTLKVPSWQYFNDQGLYIFDVIVIVTGDRFTKIDLELLFNCKRFGIPAFIVRSKANANIANIMNDDSDESEDEGKDNRERRSVNARDKFVTDTRREFMSILEDAGLPPQKVYIVSKDALRSLVKGAGPKTPGYNVTMIDEAELLKDVIQIANARHIQVLPQNT